MVNLRLNNICQRRKELRKTSTIDLIWEQEIRLNLIIYEGIELLYQKKGERIEIKDIVNFYFPLSVN